MKKILLLIWCVALMSCRSQQIIVPNDTVTYTNRQTKSIARDSVYVHDSIFVREYIQGDTVYRDKLVEHYKDRWLTRIDTLMQHDTTVVTQTQTITQTEKVKYVPAFYRWCVAILILLMLFAIAKVILKKCNGILG